MVPWKCTIPGMLAMFFLTRAATAQYSLHLITVVPPDTSEVYITGTFNNWDPGDVNYKLNALDNRHKEIVLRGLKAGEYQFKFTRGNERTFECLAAGNNRNKRIIILNTDTTLHLNIEAWADAYFNANNLSDSLLYEVMEARAGYYLEINLDSSYKYALQLYRLAQKLNLPEKEARALDLEGVVFTKQGNGEKALELFLKSLTIKKKLNDSSGVSFTYQSMAEMYKSLQDFIKARNNYLASYAWIEHWNGAYKSIPLTNIGNLLLDAGQVDSAFNYAANALLFDKNCVSALLLMGDIQKKKGKDVSALAYYKEAITASERGTPGNPLFANNAEAYKKSAGIFYKNNQKIPAFFYARKAFAIAVKVNNPFTIISTGTALADFFEKEKKYDSAFFYQQIIMQKKDSLFTEAKERQVHNIFFVEKMRLKDIEARDDRNSLQLKIYILAGAVILLLLAALAYRARSRARFNKQLSQIEMRALRAQMNPHFIFNCLASINRYIVLSDTKTASAYLTRFSRLIRLILDNSANDFISVDAEIQTLKLYVDMESLRFDNSFSYEIEYGSITRTDNTAIPTMIIQPYVENAIWHGLLHLPAGQKGNLWIRFLELREDILQIEIEDNGIGRKMAAELRSKDTIKTKSYGMQISKDRISIISKQHRINSSIIIEDIIDNAGNAVGTKVTLHLPLIEMAFKPYLVNKAV